MNINYQLYRAYVRLCFKIEKKPILILGNQKTGTSAIASLLGEATGESYTIDVFCHLGDLQKSLVEEKLSFRQFMSNSKDFFSKKIIKEPSFTFYYHELISLFPDAEFVLVIRDPFENVRSICSRLKIDGDYEGTADQIRELTYDWRLIADGDYYQHKGVNLIETLAKRAAACYSIYKKNKNRIQLIRYEDFSKAKIDEIKRLASAVGLEVKNDVASIANHQFQPKGSSVSADEFFSRKNYQLIAEACDELINDQYSITI